jgi:hypothetical protein
VEAESGSIVGLLGAPGLVIVCLVRSYIHTVSEFVPRGVEKVTGQRMCTMGVSLTLSRMNDTPSLLRRD